MQNLKAKALLEAVEQSPPGLIVEIGCIREDHEEPDDGFSTYYLAKAAFERGDDFLSYDINPDNVEMGRKVLKDNGLPGSVIQADGKIILPKLPPISFLYLDSHRLPMFSFDQYRMANLAKQAIVAIDDAHEYDGLPHGKATFLIQLFNKQQNKYIIRDTQPGFKMVIAYFPNGKISGEL